MGRPIRVCFMIDRLLVGGTETQLAALIRHLDRTRVEPFLCLLDGEDAVSRSLEPECCGVLRLGVRSLHHASTVGKAVKLGRFLRRRRIEVMQVYFPDSTYFGVPVAHLAGVPYIIRARNNLGHWMTPLDRRLGRVYNRLLVDATLANCQACRESFIADERPQAGSVFVVENGVDFSRFAAQESYRGPAPGAPRCVGMVANLRTVKDPELFVRAAGLLSERVGEVTFRIAGTGPLKASLEGLIERLGLRERVSLLGSVCDIPALLAELDVAVLCSRSEGFSNAVLEYMAAGRAIVATAVGGTTELIADGVNGLLVRAGDAVGLADAVQRVLCDVPLAVRLATQARQDALARYTRAAMVRRMEDFYVELTRERPHRSLWPRRRPSFRHVRASGRGAGRRRQGRLRVALASQRGAASGYALLA